MKAARCTSRIFFAVDSRGLLESQCKSRRCGAERGVVVMHYFHPETLELVETRRFREPASLFDKERTTV